MEKKVIYTMKDFFQAITDLAARAGITYVSAYVEMDSYGRTFFRAYAHEKGSHSGDTPEEAVQALSKALFPEQVAKQDIDVILPLPEAQPESQATEGEATTQVIEAAPAQAEDDLPFL